MSKTRNTIQAKNLASYDVYIEDNTPNSVYFQVTNLPQYFTGGRNSFFIGGSSVLQNGSSIQIEILDANNQPVFYNPVPKYIQGDARMVSVEINENTAVGPATIIVMGTAVSTIDGRPIPPDWQNTYNVRWTGNVIIEPNLRNTSQIVFLNEPTVLSEEQRLFNVATSSFTTSSIPFTASLTPTLYSGIQVGYLISAVAPTTFSADLKNGYITGSLIIDNVSASMYLPITNILNSTTAFSDGYLIQTSTGRVIDKLYLTSGSYTTPISAVNTAITSSATINYSKMDIINVNIPISYAKLRVANLNTVSGEITKAKIYSKVSTNISDYKLVANVSVTTEELLTSSSIRGDIAIGDFNLSPTASANWYSDRLETSSNVVYTISGSSAYYNSATTVTPFTLSVGDETLLRSMISAVPTVNNNSFAGQVSESGYFIGTKRDVIVFPTTEYSLTLDAYYKQTSGSVTLTGKTPLVNIYIIGVSGSSLVSNDPLGQNIGQLKVVNGSTVQWYQNQQFNFTPALSASGKVSLRFVISNGFWNFSNISIRPASDRLFSPDEAQFLVPNTEYFNDYLQHKIEFFDINNNSTDVDAISIPTFFTGSNIDLGTLP
jgi:hypothetical protein